MGDVTPIAYGKSRASRAETSNAGIDGIMGPPPKGISARARRKWYETLATYPNLRKQARGHAEIYIEHFETVKQLEGQQRRCKSVADKLVIGREMRQLRGAMVQALKALETSLLRKR